MVLKLSQTWYPMVKLGCDLGLEMSQLVQHAISRSNGLEMSQFWYPMVKLGFIMDSWNEPIGTSILSRWNDLEMSQFVIQW